MHALPPSRLSSVKLGGATVTYNYKEPCCEFFA